jgi:inner membrane protein
MDIVTHGITGVLVSRALPTGHKGATMAAGLIGALAPDLDAIARLWDPMATITFHRTVMHSFLGGAVIALAVAALVWGFRRNSFFLLFGFAFLGLLSHIGLDLLTSFGTAVFWPLSDRRFALAQNYLIDPTFTILALAFLVASFRLKHSRVSLAVTGLLAIGLYVVITGVAQQAAFSRWRDFMELQGTLPTRSAVLPIFPGPFRWLGISETQKGFYQRPFWIYGSHAGTRRFFPRNNADLRSLERQREVRVFLSFARFPWTQESYDGDLRVVQYQDLAFVDHPLGGPMTLRIWLDESGVITKTEFGHMF